MSTVDSAPQRSGTEWPALERFLGQVKGWIPYPPAAEQAERELMDHMTDRVEVLTARGTAPEEAQRQAVEAMGDPMEIGQAFDRLYPAFWHRLSHLLLGAAGVILAAALVWNCALGEHSRKLSTLLHPPGAVALNHAMFPRETAEPELLQPVGVYGRGSLGAFTLAPGRDGGTAGLYRLSTGEIQLRFVVRLDHAPWLDPMGLTARLTDDLGNEYDPSIGLYGPASGTCDTRLIFVNGVDSAARSFTFTAGSSFQHSGKQAVLYLRTGEVQP